MAKRPVSRVIDGAAREPGARGLRTGFASAVLLCAATLGIALAAGPICAAAPPPVLQFIRNDIDTGVFGQVTQGSGVGDIDGDGRPDIVVGGDNYLLWFHNPDWTPHLIASGFKFAGGAQVVVRDIDGDGRLDVMSDELQHGWRRRRTDGTYRRGSTDERGEQHQRVQPAAKGSW